MRQEKQRMTADQTTRLVKSPQPEIARNPTQRFAMACGLYLLWAGLVWLGTQLGSLQLDDHWLNISLAGIAATNALFFVLSRAPLENQLPVPVSAALQCLAGLLWITLFTAVRTGGAEFSLGMYLCAVLFALFQVGQQSFLRLSLIAALGYSAVVGSRIALVPGEPTFGPEVLNLLVFLGITCWLLVFAEHLHALRRQLRDRNLELRNMLRKVSRVAERDYLTRSFNRHYIMETLAREKGRADRSNTPVSVCIFDLDHFKDINDEFGHLVGDLILKGFAKRVRAALRAMDASNPSEHGRSFGRFGGEEFIVILPGTGLTGAAQCAERIREAIAERPFDTVSKVTVSAGVAQYRRGETVPDLLARADDALYIAKDKGRNRVETSGHAETFDAKVMNFRSQRTS